MRAWRERRAFLELLAADSDVTDRLSADDLKSCFDPAWYLRHVDTIFRRVGLLSEDAPAALSETSPRPDGAGGAGARKGSS